MPLRAALRAHPQGPGRVGKGQLRRANRAHPGPRRRRRGPLGPDPHPRRQHQDGQQPRPDPASQGESEGAAAPLHLRLSELGRRLAGRGLRQPGRDPSRDVPQRHRRDRPADEPRPVHRDRERDRALPARRGLDLDPGGRAVEVAGGEPGRANPRDHRDAGRTRRGRPTRSTTPEPSAGAPGREAEEAPVK